MKLVKLSEYFEIRNGVAKSSLNVYNNKINNNFIPYIRPAQSYESSLDGYVDKNSVPQNKIFLQYTLYVSTDGEGSHSYSYVSSFEFVPNSNVIVLVEKIPLTLEEKLFYAKCITSNRHKFSYARKPKQNRITNLLIPAKESIPAFVYKQKIKTISNKPFNDYKIKFQLQTQNWKAFKISELFDVEGTKTTPLKILEENGIGKYPYITTKATNNGCDGFYNIKTEAGNIITVDSAVIGYASYQIKDFSASDHVEKLIPKFILNKFIAMFLTTILNQEQYRFHYGRKASQNRLKALQITLPTTPQGEPDWQLMENYIKSLPYSSSL